MIPSQIFYTISIPSVLENFLPLWEIYYVTNKLILIAFLKFYLLDHYIYYYILLYIIIIITKSYNNCCSLGVIELCLLNLLVLIDCFLCNSSPYLLFESLSQVIDQESSHAYSRNLGKTYLISLGRFQNFKKVNSVNLSQISLLNTWLLVQILDNYVKPVNYFHSSFYQRFLMAP